MSTPDPKLKRVRRAFDAAADRLRAATTQAEVEDELSNLLHHLYRLGEVCWKQLGLDNQKTFDKQLRDSPNDSLRAARTALWLRAADTHDLVVVDMATPPPHGDTYYDSYNPQVEWKPFTQTGLNPKDKRYKDYPKVLEGKPVLDTMRDAFDALAKLL